MYTSLKERDMFTPHKRKQIMVDRQKLTSTHNDSGISFVYDIKKNHGCKSTIHELDLANGLIDLLIENNFTLKSLMDTSSSELSKTLGIDQEVATLICKAAKNKKSTTKEICYMHDSNHMS
jgi:hypothetical protein